MTYKKKSNNRTILCDIDELKTLEKIICLEIGKNSLK